ncbi:MAG: 4Fe-4S cluster-binding domain-containing protein [Candidatus Omnitrophica bacterium]|nr:4Fe-4S cluster-binding domain-containing protein [Candidatus Omnitrophota bacterium]
MNLKAVAIPKNYNYIACFLTLDCNICCDYCINSQGRSSRGKCSIISGEKWAEALNRIDCDASLPVTLQGGEPSLHPDFIWIIKNIRKDLNIDILTNLTFDVDVFIKEIDPCRLSRGAVYSNLRVSYHPEHMDLGQLLKNALKLQTAGFSIGLYGILHPKFKSKVLAAQNTCLKSGIDFRTKEFLGEYDKKFYGTYFYPDAVGTGERKRCLCRTSELIIGPGADIFRCHHDLYNSFSPVGNLLDPQVSINNSFRECGEFGDCNPCDVKLKTNRFQQFGHTSVQIEEIAKEGK